VELEATWERVVKVWWSYLWRNLLAVIVAMLFGAIFGGIMGFILGMMHVQKSVIVLVTAPIGFLFGLAVSIVPMKPILGKDFGEFRLVLLSKGN
jgi:ABC-type amino acid transport system permease subunit